MSFATNLVAGVADSNGAGDTFLKPRGSATDSLLSHVPSEDATGELAAIPTEVVLEGALATFSSNSLNLIDTPISSEGNLYYHGSLLMADGFETGDLTAWSQHVP